jgi:hypothetical protein
MNNQEAIAKQCDAIKELLLEKNRKYGDAALQPLRVFSRSPIHEQINVRLDDKLSRIVNRQNDEDEDPILDLVGYLILLLVANKASSEPVQEVREISPNSGVPKMWHNKCL